MGEDLDVPVKKYSPKDNKTIYLKYGINQVQGWKKSMEDYTIDFADKDDKKCLNIFGIFDGHGGREVPKYLSAHFWEFLKKNTNYKNCKFKDALYETFFEVDKSFMTKEGKEELDKYSDEFKKIKEEDIENANVAGGAPDKLNKDEIEQIITFNEVFDPRNIENTNIAEFTGATGIIVFIGDKNIFIANAGNSRCLVLNAKGEIIKKTKDHTLNDETEKKRVTLARNFNEEEEERLRKKGNCQQKVEFLESTRGFGDWEFKDNQWIDQKDQEVTVEPEIFEVPAKDVKYIIIGSHGMFEDEPKTNEDDTNKKVCDYFYQELKKEGGKAYSKIIEGYFENIISKDKTDTKGFDNMSCIVIGLDEENIAKFIKVKEKEMEERKKKEEEERRKKKEEMRKKAEEERLKRQKTTDSQGKVKEPEKKPEPKKEEVKEEKKEEVKEEKKEENKIEVIKEEPKEEEKNIDNKEELVKEGEKPEDNNKEVQEEEKKE